MHMSSPILVAPTLPRSSTGQQTSCLDRRRRPRAATAALLATIGTVATGGSAVAGTIFTLESKATFLHTASADSSINAAPIDLASLSVVPGARIELRRLGDYDNGPGGDAFTGMIAIFSSSATLLPASNLQRVPGALDVGVDVSTSPTFFGGEPTDIPEDFIVSSGDFPSGEICILVPPGATHLFVCTHDSLYEDNSDPDGDWGFELGLLDECAADVDGNGAVDGGDLGTLLAGWGVLSVIGGPGDLDCDGDVDGADLGLLLSAWGPC